MWRKNTVDSLTLAWLLSPQSSLMKFAESLQEMINYHTVRCSHWRRVKPDVISCRPSSLPPLQPEGGGGARLGAGLTLCSSSSAVMRPWLLLGKRLQQAAREEMALCFRWPSAGGGKMAEHLQKCHSDFGKDDYALSSWFCFLKQLAGFREASSTCYGEICFLIVIKCLWRSCDLLFLR